MLSSDVAWLLRMARVCATDPSLRTAATFAAGAGVVAPVHRSQVTRWESGEAKASHALVRRYEAVLSLPPGQILTAIDVLARIEKPIRPLPALDRAVPENPAAVAMPLMEQVLGDGQLSAAEWDQLSWLLGAMPHVLLRRNDCEVLMRRGLEEMAVPNRLLHLQRRESMARLAGNRRVGVVLPSLARHAGSGQAGSGQAGSGQAGGGQAGGGQAGGGQAGGGQAGGGQAGGDVDGRVCSNALGLLPYSTSLEAGAAAVRELEEPLNADTLSAALVSSALLLRRGQLTAEQADRACHLAWEHLCASQSFRISRNCADALLILDISSRRRLGRALLVQRADTASAAILSGAGSHPSTSSQRLAARIRVHLEGRHGDGLEDRPTLTRLLCQAGRETNDELHAAALAVLSLSPIGPAIGVAYGVQLTESLAVMDHLAAHQARRVLRWLQDPAALEQPTEIGLDDASSEKNVRASA